MVHLAPTPAPEAFGVHWSLGPMHTVGPEPGFAPLLSPADCTAAALIMHKRVAGWHTPDLQSEFALHLAPTLPVACARAGPVTPAAAPITQTAKPILPPTSRHCRLSMPVDPIIVSCPENLLTDSASTRQGRESTDNRLQQPSASYCEVDHKRIGMPSYNRRAQPSPHSPWKQFCRGSAAPGGPPQATSLRRSRCRCSG
jgi:hypothetical protein